MTAPPAPPPGASSVAPAPPPGASIAEGRGAWLAVMLAASAALVATLWTVGYLPTNDGPQHVLSGYIENHYEDAGSPYRGYLTLLPAFAARGFSLLFEPLEALFGWRAALRLTESVMALGMLWGFASLVLALERTRGAGGAPTGPRRWAAPLGAVVALPWAFYMGFFPSVVATMFGLFVLAFALWRPELTARRRGVVAGMLLLEAVMHVFSACLTGAVLLALGVAAARGRRLREAALTAAMGAPAAAIAALTLLDRRGLADVVLSHGTVWESFADRLRALPGSAVAGPPFRGWLALALVLAVCAATLQRARRGQASRAEATLAVLAPALVALTLLTPLNLPGWQFFSGRFAGLGVLLGLALVDLEQVRPRRFATAAPALLAAASLVVTYRFHATLAGGCADLTSGLGRGLARGGWSLPIVLDPMCAGLDRSALRAAVPHLAPTPHAGALYAVDRGGLQPYMFMGMPSVHALDPRPDAEHPFFPATNVWAELLQPRMREDAAHRRRTLSRYVLWGMPFESVLLYGASAADQGLFAERGYEPEWQQGSLLIARFRPCTAALELPGRDDDAPVLVELGLTPVEEPADRRLYRAAKTARKLPLLGGVCGPLWVRVIWDLDRSGTVTPGDVRCEGADPTGRFEVEVTREVRVVACKLARSPGE